MEWHPAASPPSTGAVGRLRSVSGTPSRPRGRPQGAHFPAFNNLCRRAYYERFREGVDCYLSGDWEWARDFLQWCVAQHEDDTPPKLLLEFMGEYNFEAPPGWPGYRAM